MKQVLVIHYSQTGQLTEILENFICKFSNCEVTRIKVDPVEKYPFPSVSDAFFDAMPETVNEVPVELKPFNIPEKKYDLIILGYQPWFLSPSIPTSSIIQHEQFLKSVKGTDVVTVCGARNMWLNAFDSIRNSIEQAGGNLILNVPLTDRNPNLISALTILHWLFSGKKDRKYGILPIPGVHPDEIKGAEKLGAIFWNKYSHNQTERLQEEINEAGDFKIPVNILFIELRAKRLFHIWAKLILKAKTYKSRIRRGRIFKYYLLIALFLISPFVLLLFNILIRPFTFKTIQRQKHYYLNISKYN